MPSMFRVERWEKGSGQAPPNLIPNLLLLATVFLALTLATAPASSQDTLSVAERGTLAAALTSLPSSAQHAQMSGQDQAHALATRVVHRHLRSMVETFERGNPGERQMIQDQLESVTTPDELKAALSATRTRIDAVPTGRVQGHFRVNGRLAPFVAYVPEDYTPDKSWPVHIALHGGGGSEWRSCDTNWDMGLPSKSGVILFCPGVDKAGWWLPHGEATLLSALSFAREHYNVDTDRVSVGGASSGGFGAWHAVTKYPWLFRSAVVRCAATPRDPETLGNLSGRHIYMTHGTADPQISVTHSRNSATWLSGLGIDVEYKEVAQMGHRFAKHLNPSIVSWLRSSTRTRTASFDYRLLNRGAPPSRLHWLKMDWETDENTAMPLKASGKISARLTQPLDEDGEATNQVFLKTDVSADSALTVLLPDGLWSPDHPVQVHHNGALRYEGRPTPSVHAVLASWVNHKDPRLLTTYAIVVP